MIVGVDEVGRGSWAGPLLIVAASAIYDLPEGLKDSKLLSRKQRSAYFEEIKQACKIGEGWVQPEEIDKHGLTKAMRIGVSRALLMLGANQDDQIIMDGKINYCPAEFANVQCIVDADATHPIVSAASIYAKVLRDEHMVRLAQMYPEYALEKHVGYGTELHRLLLRVHGVSKIHRKSFKPVQTVMAGA